MIVSGKSSGDILDPKKRLNPNNCTSSHGTTGFLEGTVYDESLGMYQCACGRQYRSEVKRPNTVQVIHSGQVTVMGQMPSFGAVPVAGSGEPLFPRI